MTIKTTGIQKRGNKYYLRIRIPKDCQAALNKKEVIRSLGTSDKTEALIKAQDLRAEWGSAFNKIKKSSDGQKIVIRTLRGR